MAFRSADLIESRIGNLVFARPRAVSGQEVELPDENVTTLEGIRTVVEFWSQFENLVTVTTTSTDVTLPSITVAGLPAGAVVDRAFARLRFRAAAETSTSDNNLVSGGGTALVDTAEADAIIIENGMLFIPASSTSEPGVTWEGAADISSVVDGNGTYSFTFEQAKSAGNNLLMRDIQVGLVLEYHVQEES